LADVDGDDFLTAPAAEQEVTPGREPVSRRVDGTEEHCLAGPEGDQSAEADDEPDLHGLEGNRGQITGDELRECADPWPIARSVSGMPMVRSMMPHVLNVLNGVRDLRV
jgi:hypothetical protein